MRLFVVALVASIAAALAGGTAGFTADSVQCGVISNYVRATASTAGSFDLATTSGNLKVAVPAGQVGGAGGYACVAVSSGANGLVLTGFLTPGAVGYVPQQGAVGQLPSTSTQPSSGSATYLALLALVLASLQLPSTSVASTQAPATLLLVALAAAGALIALRARRRG